MCDTCKMELKRSQSPRVSLDEIFETCSTQNMGKDVGTFLGFSGSQRRNKRFVYILYQTVVGKLLQLISWTDYLLIPVFVSNIVLVTKRGPFNPRRKNVSSITNWKGCSTLPPSRGQRVDVHVWPSVCQEQTDSHIDWDRDVGKRVVQEKCSFK